LKVFWTNGFGTGKSARERKKKKTEGTPQKQWRGGGGRAIVGRSASAWGVTLSGQLPWKEGAGGKKYEEKLFETRTGPKRPAHDEAKPLLLKAR